MFGIYGDPDIGGADLKDDNGLFLFHLSTHQSHYTLATWFIFDPDKTGDAGGEGWVI